MSKPHTQTCPIASFLNVFGDAWTWMIVREAFYGTTRFTEFRRNTGIAKNLLSDRLSKLVDVGVLEREDVGEKGTRYAYQLTAKGRALTPMMVAMVQWSNEELHEPGHEPIRLIERGNGRPVAPLVPRAEDGRELTWREIATETGPGADRAARRRFQEMNSAEMASAEVASGATSAAESSSDLRKR